MSKWFKYTNDRLILKIFYKNFHEDIYSTKLFLYILNVKNIKSDFFQILPSLITSV